MKKVLRITSKTGEVFEVALSGSGEVVKAVAGAMVETGNTVIERHIKEATVWVQGRDLIVKYVEQGEEHELLIEKAAEAASGAQGLDATDAANAEVSPIASLEDTQSATPNGSGDSGPSETTETGSGFGGSGLIYGLLGLGGLGALVAAASGGKGGGSRSEAPADPTPPNAPTGLDLAAEDDSGANVADNVTSQASGLTLRGQAEANARVELFTGTTSLGTATADGSGAFSLDVTLATGAHAITAKATDAAGNVGAASDVLTVTVDGQRPGKLAVSLANDAGLSGDLITFDPQLSILNREDTATLIYSSDGGATWSSSYEYSRGLNDILVAQVDNSGNTSDASAITFSLYDEAPDYQWINLLETGNSALPPMDGASIANFNGQMFLVGGWLPDYFVNDTTNGVYVSSDGITWNIASQDTFNSEEFDPDTSFEGRHTFPLLVFDDKMWIMGGDPLQGHYQSDIWTSSNGYDWDKFGELPFDNRALVGGFVFDGFMYLIGGQSIPQSLDSDDPNKNTDVVYKEVYRSLNGLTWETVDSSDFEWPARSFNNNVLVHDGKIFIIGGGVYDTPANPGARTLYNDVWSSSDGVHWDLVSDANQWMPRMYHETASFDGKMWIFGGWSNGNLNDVWWSEDGKTWNPLDGTPWNPRHATSVVDYQGELHLIVGNYNNDAWKLDPIVVKSPDSISDLDTAVNYINEGANAGEAVGITVSSTGSEIVNYSVVKDQNGEAHAESPFQVNFLTGEVSVRDGSLIDFEGQSHMSLHIRADRADGTVKINSFEIMVGDRNEGAVSMPIDDNPANNIVLEGAPNGAKVGVTALALDPDSSQDVTYHLVDAGDWSTIDEDGPFSIDSISGVVTIRDATMLDFSSSEYLIHIRASSADGSDAIAPISIKLAQNSTLDAFVAQDPINLDDALHSSHMAFG